MTTIKITPPNQVTSLGGAATVTVDCIPTEPIKAFQFNVSFNPSSLQVLSIQQGSFFDGYQTFFNPGVIYNEEGIVSDIYNLTIGSGNTVSDPGSFVKITFESVNKGTSPIQLDNVLVTNNVDPISTTIENGSITVYDVKITDSKSLTIQVIHE